MADDVQRDTDEEALASRAGMALVGLAVCRAAFALLVAAFVWLLALRYSPRGSCQLERRAVGALVCAGHEGEGAEKGD